MLDGANGETIIGGDALPLHRHITAGCAGEVIGQRPPPEPLVKHRLSAIECTRAVAGRERPGRAYLPQGCGRLRNFSRIASTLGARANAFSNLRNSAVSRRNK